MSAVLFYDPVCQQPYDTRTLRAQALGGTEATLVRVADALGAWVVQHNRAEDWERYRRPQPLAGIDSVIVNREPGALRTVQERYPGARVYLWLHDRIEPGGKRARSLAAHAPLLRRMAVTAVCVSDWQRSGVEAVLRGSGVGSDVRALTLYNPVDDALTPDGTAVDPNKLVFFSSPNKGLAYALDAFDELRRRMPELRLVVGNPGYKADPVVRRAGVEFVGAQPQARMHAEVRGALCTFHPNFVIPETFGLVFAESHALGTPVLTYACGAAPEIVADPGQLLPVTGASRWYEALVGGLPESWRQGPARIAGAAGLFDACVWRVRNWRGGARPVSGPDPRFRLSTVIAQWRALLSG